LLTVRFGVGFLTVSFVGDRRGVASVTMVALGQIGASRQFS
jgi:hypothetical protein